MNSNGKHKIVIAILHAEKSLADGQMAATADGQVFRQPLYEA